MRISELAKKIGVKSTDIIALLEKKRITGKRAASTIEESLITEVESKLTEKGLAKATTKKTTAKKTTKTKIAKKVVKAAVKKTTKISVKKAKAEISKEATVKDEEKARKRVEEEAKKRAEEEERKIAEEKARQKEREELQEIEKLIEEDEKKKREAEAKAIVIDEAVTVKEFAEKLKLPVNEIIKKLFLKRIAVTVNQTLGADLAKEIAKELDFTIKLKYVEEKEKKKIPEVDISNLPVRPPVVTVMGHVDHGKTSLLDSIRNTNVVGGETGGITQHIGAYSVKISNGNITFLDTPGHEAFTALRARGAKVTDLVVLVVAADDGVMPQTVEAINHAMAANVTIMVAINKIDKPDAQPDKIRQGLSKYNLIPEQWGGQTIFCNVSAKTGEGIDHLLDMILLQSEILELRAEANQDASATIIESKLDKNRGPIHAIIVNKGTLKVGNSFVMGTTYGKVRAMINDKGGRLQSAGPSFPVELLGANRLCEPGETLTVVENDRKARQISHTREDVQREKRMAKQHTRLENVVDILTGGKVAELRLVIKADAQGSVDAVREVLSKLELEEVKIHVIHSGVGGITESDISLADASDAIVIGFNVRPTDKAKTLSEKTNIELRLYNVIYEIIEDMESSLKGMLKPKFREKTIGRAEVRDTFKISRLGTIAGCMILQGIMRRNADVRLIRDNVVVHTSILASLRRFKDDVKEVQTGYECGIGIENYNDIKVGDIIELFIQEELAP